MLHVATQSINVELSLRSRRLEVVGTRKNGRARRRLTPCVSPSRAPVLSFARFFQAPATQATSNLGVSIDSSGLIEAHWENSWEDWEKKSNEQINKKEWGQFYTKIGVTRSPNFVLLARGSTGGNAYGSVNSSGMVLGVCHFFFWKLQMPHSWAKSAFKCPPRGGNKWLKNRKRA